VGAGDAPGDRQAQAGAAAVGRPGVVEAHQPVEDALPVRRCHAGPIVADRQMRATGHGLDLDGEPAGRVPTGVVEHVGQNLPDPARIGRHDRRAAGHCELDAGGEQPDPVSLHPGEVEQVPDEPLEAVRLAPGQRASVRTGIAVAIPPGQAGLVLPRSGLAARHGVALVNAPGLIDAGYRGEVRVLLLNTDQRASFAIAPGDRIAQLVLVRVEAPEVIEADELALSERGAGGFGSSG